ncbi:MAG: hypothetical protein CMK09_04035 [Ponticaulis sp.]|nr:hypothetical protein [Ponticaulis sp.]
MKPWKVLSSRQTFKDPWLSVRTDKVEQPSGQILEDYHVIEYPDWVSVLAFTPEGRLIIIQ